jgi:hypothetical protein
MNPKVRGSSSRYLPTSSRVDVKIGSANDTLPAAFASFWGSFLLRLSGRSACANQPHEGVDLFRNSRPVGTEILLEANSAKERDD